MGSPRPKKKQTMSDDIQTFGTPGAINGRRLPGAAKFAALRSRFMRPKAVPNLLPERPVTAPKNNKPLLLKSSGPGDVSKKNQMCVS